jgi:hypothetical protein
MQNLGAGNPAVDQDAAPNPAQGPMLTATPERAEPMPDDLAKKGVQTVHVARHRVVVEPALHHRAQPMPDGWDWPMPAMTKLALQRLKLA